MGYIHHANACSFMALGRECDKTYKSLKRASLRQPHATELITKPFCTGNLKNFIADCPFKIHTILTDNGSQFTYALLAEHLRPKDKIHPFDAVCEAEGIRHKLTKFKHPWTNGQVEVMNKIIKKNTTKTYHYDSVDDLKKHLMAFLLAYNFQRKLKALKFKSPYDTLISIWTSKPELFKINPTHKTLGLNIQSTNPFREQC